MTTAGFTNCYRQPVRPRRANAFTLIEMLVYMTVLLILTGIGYVAMYRSMDNSRALRRSTSDVADALHAGENWRADVRAAGYRIQVETNETEEVFLLSGPRGEVSWRFATNTVFRRLGNNDWSLVLANVETAAFVADPRPNVNAWRWELELRTRAKKLSRIRPLFTFISVPAGTTSK